MRTLRGLQVQGAVLDLSPHQVVMEVYEPEASLRMSEILDEISIHRGPGLVYRGRGVITSLFGSGDLLILAATLVDPWPEPRAEMEAMADLRGFVAAWDERRRRMRPSFRLGIATSADFLRDLRQRLAQGAAEARFNLPDGAERSRLWLDRVETDVAERLDQHLFGFEADVADLEPTEAPVYKAFVQRELHPLLLCSPFVQRTLSKPLGHGGDFAMIDMILGSDRDLGGSPYARLISRRVLAREPAQAHRNRIGMLVQSLAATIDRCRAQGRPMRGLAIGCGPALEIARLRSRRGDAPCRFDLIDFDQPALDHARQSIEGGRTPPADDPWTVRYIRSNLAALLSAEGLPRSGTGPGTYDLVWCAGLFDYLSDRICSRLLSRLFEVTAVGGAVLATNVHPSNPIRGFMENVLEWYINHRDGPDLLSLAGQLGQARVFSDPTGINLFLEVRRPDPGTP